MKSNRKRPARVLDSSDRKPAPRARQTPTPLSDSPKPSDGLYTRVDISVEDLFEHLSKLLAGALPPPFDHLDEHVQLGRQFHSSDGSADRDGNHALAVLIRLRQEAADQVERLLTFLDQTEGGEDLEDGGDLSMQEIRAKGGWDAPSTDDDEMSGDENEPSLGSANPTIWGNGGVWSTPTPEADLEDEHDGAEDDRDQEGDDDPDREPSLGWTIDGVAGRAVDQRTCDLEVQTHAAVKPQDRTDWQGPQISAESTYRKFLYGLTADQERAFRGRMTEQSGTTSVAVG